LRRRCARSASRDARAIALQVLAPLAPTLDPCAPAHAVRLARLVAFGGALLLTAYGAREMYASCRSADHVSRMGDGRPVRDQLLVDRARLYGKPLRVLLSACGRRARRPLPKSLSIKTAVVMPIYNEAPSRVFAPCRRSRKRSRRRGSATHSISSFSPTPPIPTSGSPRSAR